MPTYTYDHIHLRSQDPMETARYFNKMFDAKILETVQSDGQTRVDLDINGLIIFIARAPADAPYVGLDHFGLRVENMEEAVAQLRERGAEFSTEPRDLRPGLKIAFVRAPGNIRIELLERS